MQEFLKLQNEEVISRFEKLLKNEKNFSIDESPIPMTQKELDKRIDNSENDFVNKRHKSSAELLAKYQ